MADEEITQEACRYFYQLIPTENPPEDSAGKTRFALYVERTDADGVPLHAGSISLATSVTLTDSLGFEPAEGWNTMAIPYTGIGGSGGLDNNGPETGTTEQGQSYISFYWYWGMAPEDAPTAPPGESDGHPKRQFIGTLIVPADGLTSDNIKLLPWPDTPIGKQQVADWQGALDQEAFLEVIKNTWRMPVLTVPGQGYYQGFHVEKVDDSAEVEKGQLAVDLTAGWEGFTLSAYAPKKAGRVLFYQPDETAEGNENLVAYANLEFYSGSGGNTPEIGYFTKRIDFESLTYYSASDELLGSLPDGTYHMVLTKPSHVTWEMDGLTFTDGSCSTLLGVAIDLPCGDIAVLNQADTGIYLGDGLIALEDRSVLLSYLHRGRNISAENPIGDDGAPNEAYYADLNGDGAVSLADFNILMLRENFHHTSIQGIQSMAKEIRK